MSSFRVTVQPSVLIWARESVRLSQEEAAKKIGVSVERLQEWEAGASAPTYKQLQLLAEKYKRPVAVLYLPRPPKHYDALKNYRRTLEQAGIELPYELVVEFERVRMQQDVMQEIFELDDRPRPTFDLVVRPSMRVETVASSLRAWLSFDLEQQRRWARRKVLVTRLSELIERRGILVAQVQRVAIDVMRGCALSDHAFPAIILNGADAPTAKVFTLVHEVVHILLHANGETAVVPVTPERPRADTEIERFCNAVAAATLISADLPHFDLDPVDGHLAPWTMTRLESIAADLGVSPQALLIRLIGLGRATWSEYAALRGLFEARRTREPVSEDAPIHYPLKVRDLGRNYIREVLAAYAREDISTSEIADYLQIKIDKLPKLMRQVATARA